MCSAQYCSAGRCGVAAYEDRDEYEAWLDYLEAGGIMVIGKK